MNKIYCQSCGKATEYSLTKPKFCGFCTHPYESIANTPLVTKPPVHSPPPRLPQAHIPPTLEGLQVQIDEDDTYEEPVIESQGGQLEVDIVATPRNKSTVGGLMQTGGGKPNTDFERPKQKKVSKKQFLEDFAREAGAIRPMTRVHNNKAATQE